MKLYIGCALTDSPSAFKKRVSELKKVLKATGHEVFDFVGLVAGTPTDVYKWDIGHCVKECDAFIAICDYPSIGLGYELSEAVRHKKPVLALAHNDSKVTRLVLGAAQIEDNFEFQRYTDLGKATLPLINEWLAKVEISA